MKKKILTTLSVVLVLALAALGILAYLTSEDSDVNVMTLGEVSIDQHEYERVNDTDKQDELKDFSSTWKATEKKPLYPAVYPGSSTTDSIPWAPENEWVKAGEQAWKVVADNDNVVDKFVTVENNGKSPAYVRTLIAYEGDATYGPEGPYIHIVTNGYNVDPAINISAPVYINVNGEDYTVYAYTYPAALAAGEESIPSLKQVYMDHTADNDVVAKYGEEYNIAVLSQAVQTEGFTDAITALNTGFAEVSQANEAIITGWFKEILDATVADKWDGTSDTSWYNDTDTEFVLYTAEELAGFEELVNAGNTFAGKTVKLGINMELGGHQWTPIGSWNTYVFSGTFDGQGNTISNLTIDKTNASGTERLALFGYIKNATIQNFEVESAEISANAKTARGAVVVMCAEGTSNTISGVTVNDSKVTMESTAQTYACGVVAWANAGTSMNMSDISVSGLKLTASQTDSSFAKVAGVMGYLYNADGKASNLDGFDVSDVKINVTSPKASVGGVLADTNKGSLKVLNGKVNNVAMNVNGSGEKDLGGLIGYTYKVDHLTVENVAITGLDIDFSGSSSRVAGVTGWDQSVSDYKNVTVAGAINENITTGSGSEVGGFVGISYYYPKTYNDCSADVDVVTGGVAGGFVGTSCTNGWANQTDAYTNCIARGDVGADTAGGFVGKGWLTNNTTLALTNVESHGSVTGKYQAGGLLGGAWQNNKGGNVVIKKYVASKNVAGTASTTLVGEIVGDKWVNNFTVEN